jgi:hypothetical protein
MWPLCSGRLVVLLTNVRLNPEDLERANTTSYFSAASVTNKKSVVALTPGAPTNLADEA